MYSEEIWKTAYGFPDYEVSNYGDVINKHGKLMTHKIDKNGYHTVGLSKDNKRTFVLVARLVLLTFNYAENHKMLQANHKDENKDNNYIGNLEWTTPKDNCNHGSRNEKCKMAVIKPIICVETGEIYESAREAERRTGTNYGCISMVLHGKRKHAGGFTWRFLNDT